MAKLTDRQKQLCEKHGYFMPNKHSLLWAMWEEGMLDNLYTPFYLKLSDRLKYIYKTVTLKDLDQMLEYKQLKVQDFCESKEY